MALCPRWTGSSLKAATGSPPRRCTEPRLTATFCTSFDWVGRNRLALVGTMQSCMHKYRYAFSSVYPTLVPYACRAYESQGSVSRGHRGAGHRHAGEGQAPHCCRPVTMFSRLVPKHPSINLGMLIFLSKQVPRGDLLSISQSCPPPPTSWQMYRREVVSILCDEESRRTGRLCKVVTVVDLNHASLAQVCSEQQQHRPCSSSSSSMGPATAVSSGGAPLP